MLSGAPIDEVFPVSNAAAVTAYQQRASRREGACGAQPRRSRSEDRRRPGDTGSRRQRSKSLMPMCDLLESGYSPSMVSAMDARQQPSSAVAMVGAPATAPRGREWGVVGVSAEAAGGAYYPYYASRGTREPGANSTIDFYGDLVDVDVGSDMDAGAYALVEAGGAEAEAEAEADAEAEAGAGHAGGGMQGGHGDGVGGPRGYSREVDADAAAVHVPACVGKSTDRNHDGGDQTHAPRPHREHNSTSSKTAEDTWFELGAYAVCGLLLIVLLERFLQLGGNLAAP